MIQIKYSKIIVVGSGPSGYTSLIYLSKINLNPILITGNILGGQLISTNEINNWPSYIKISGAKLMEKFFLQTKNNNIEIIIDEVCKINCFFKPFIFFSKLFYFFSEMQIICMGAFPKFLSILNEKKFLGKNISTCTICDGNFYKNKKIAIVGGGDVAMESLFYLKSICKKIILLHRNKKFNFNINSIKKIFNKKFSEIEIKFNVILLEIIGDNNIFIYIKIINIINNIINVIFLDGMFISIGYKPNTDIFLGQININKGYFILNESNYCNYINLSGFFIGGDIKYNIYKQAITSSSSGAIAAIDLYHFFNKFS